MMPDALGEFDTKLRERFTGLRDARCGEPVHALEHGLTSAELRCLRLAAGPVLRRDGVAASWTDRPLGLLVLATETGYRYRGTGTDFWPVLGARLGAAFTGADRERLTSLFETAHRSVGLRRPAATPWNLAFRHIAWPIANAIAPLEIHRALAGALHRMFRRPPEIFDGADLAAALRRAAAADGAGPRLLQWLADEQLAAAMARHLLGLPDENRLDAQTVRRIWKDMSGDVATRRALGHALSEHRQLQAAPRGYGRYGRAHLALRRALSGFSLELVTPVLSRADQDRLAAFGERPVRLWGATTEVALRRLTEGQPIPLTLERLPDGRDAFLSEAALKDLDATSASFLRSLAPDVDGPLLFSGAVGASPRVDRVREEAGGLWRLIARRRVTEQDDVSIVGRVGEAYVVEAHLGRPGVRAWLEAQGVIVELGPVLEPLVAAALDRRPEGHDLPDGLPAIFRMIGASRKATAKAGPHEAILSPGEPILLVEDDEPGDHRITLETSDAETVAGWRRLPERSRPAPVILAAEAEELTLEALREGSVSLRLSFPPTFTTPDLTLIVIAGGVEVARSVTRTQGAALIGGGTPVFQTLGKQLASEVRFDRGELVAQLGAVIRERWPLGRRLHVVRWTFADGVWIPSADDEVLQTATVSSGAPHLSPGAAADTDGVTLHVPIRDGETLDTEGLVVGPRRLTFSPSADGVDLEGVGRSWDAPGDTGLKASALAWLRWSCASSSHVIVDMGRRRVVQALERRMVRQLCGRSWLADEERLLGYAGDFWQLLAAAAVRRNMAAGEGFPSLPDSSRFVLRDCLAARLRSAAPDLQTMSELELDAASPDLDQAVNDAWEDYFQELERGGASFHLEDECDAGNDGSAWIAAAREAEERSSLTPLALRLTPQTRGRALARFDYAADGQAEVMGLLAREHLDLRSRQPHWLSEADIQRGLLFWIAPRTFAQDVEGFNSLRRLLSDRQTARAIRYAALRHGQARGIAGAAR